MPISKGQTIKLVLRSLNLEDWTDGSPETLVSNHGTPHNNPEDGIISNKRALHKKVGNIPMCALFETVNKVS
jgi:hypothetical protein